MPISLGCVKMLARACQKGRSTSYLRRLALAAGLLLGANLPVIAGSVMTLPSSFAVDYMGSATLNIPIAVPPGRAGMTPHLSLSYSSSNGNGYVGVGWSLSGLPAIVRCPHTIATNGVAGPVTLTNYDVFCFQGQPLVQAQQQRLALRIARTKSTLVGEDAHACFFG